MAKVKQIIDAKFHENCKQNKKRYSMPYQLPVQW